METIYKTLASLAGSIIAGITAALISYSVIAIRYKRKDIAAMAILCCIVSGIAWGLATAILVSIAFIFLTLYITRNKNKQQRLKVF